MITIAIRLKRPLFLASAFGLILFASACSYSYKSNVLGYRTGYSLSTPGAAPPPPSSPPPARCWVQPHYNHMGYWVQGHYRAC